MGIVKAWTSMSLVLRIIIGLVIGAILGIMGNMGMMPEAVGTVISLLGDLFVGALKAVAPILVFFLVMSALANAKTGGGMSTIVVLYVLVTFIAAVVAVVACYLVPLDITLVTPDDVENTPPSGVGEVLLTLAGNVVANPIDALANANYLGILAWSIVIGMALRVAAPHTKTMLSNISDAIATVVRWIISCAPFGILGLVYTAVATSGPQIFTEYGMLIALLVCCMLFIALVTNPLVAFICMRKNPYPLVLRCLKDSGITAFFTRSSAANIPVNMELCRKLGLDKDNYSVSIPLGATINMAGAAVTITVMSMTAAHTLGVAIDPISAVILSVLAAVSACGASGVAGGSLLLIPLACSLFGIDPSISMQVVGVGFIIGVIQDSCETALNSSSDVLFTAVAEYRDRLKKGIPFEPGKDAPAPTEVISANAVTEADLDAVLSADGREN